jgi:hypothetical protein
LIRPFKHSSFHFLHFTHQRFERDLKPIITSTAVEDHHREQHNSILMNDDCKLLQVQDEQASRCADKYCKNSQATTAPQQHHNDGDKNPSKINEISTTNSRINRKHNLNLDLYFDKELSAWLAERERKQQQIEPRTDKDIEIAITNTDDDMTKTRDNEWNSSEKLSNEMISIGTNNFDDNSSNSHRHFCDSSFSSSSSTCNNSEIDMRLIDARCLDKKSDNGVNDKSSTFTDGEYIYGPYNFDLFSNEFYHFRDEEANDDEAENHRRINKSELLKNHDEVDNAAEVSFVRDMETEKGCENLRNNNSDMERQYQGMEMFWVSFLQLLS